VNYRLFRVLTWVFGVLPEPVTRRIGRGLGYTLSFFAGRKLEMAERHMARARGTPQGARKAARRMFASYGRYWAEVFWMRPRRFDQIVKHADVTGLEHVEAARGDGIVLALPHVGNWEAAGARAVAEGVPVLAVAEALGDPRIVEWFVAVRARFGIEVIIADRSASVTKALFSRLREKGTIALPCDRDIGGGGIPVTFFGEETTLPAGPVALAERTGAHLLVVGCYFKKGRGHRLVVQPRLEIPSGATTEERVEKGTQELAYRLEEAIRAQPEQWHMMVPNWPSDRA
jgi:KDO2-lipid IV(A) lauroyltransferase